MARKTVKKQTTEQQNIVTELKVVASEYVEVAVKNANNKNLIIYTPNGIVAFKDGKAKVRNTTKELLENMGVI